MIISRWGAVFALVVVIAIGLYVWRWFGPGGFLPAADITPPLLVEFLGPEPAADGAIPAEPLAVVWLEYRLTNASAQPLRNLQARPNCQCTVPEPLPAALEPGASVTYRVRYQAPEVGRHQAKLPIHAAGREQPLATLTAAVQVRPRLPSVLRGPDRLQWHWLANEPCTAEWTILTIEAANQPAWLTGGHVDSPALNVELVQVVEDHAGAPEGVRRRYHFRVRVNEPIEHMQGRTVINYSAQPKGPSSIPVEWSIVPPAVALPAQLRLESGLAPQAVTILRRDRKTEPLHPLHPVDPALLVTPDPERPGRFLIHTAIESDQKRTIPLQFLDEADPEVQVTVWVELAGKAAFDVP